MNFLRSFLLVFILAVPVPAAAQEGDIRDVISSQIDAFLEDDFVTAFTFAHPSIRNMFRTPDNFGRMVRNGYPMVWRPAEVDYLDLRQENGRIKRPINPEREFRMFGSSTEMAACSCWNTPWPKPATAGASPASGFWKMRASAPEAAFRHANIPWQNQPGPSVPPWAK